MDYKVLRSRLRTGGVIVWKSRGVLPWAIRRFTEYSHASLVVRMDEFKGLQNRVFLVEALGSGLELRLLSERLAGTAGEAFAFTPDIPAASRLAIRDFALVECARGVRYDFGGLLRNALGRVSSDARRYFCSEFVWQAWVQAGVVRDLTGKAPRPGDIIPWCKKQGVAGPLWRIEGGA